ncbi:PAS domain S-box-containing protein/diguanylate cyclase (GGDEF) domain-containing protein [Pseudoxanthomonas sp. GM95]|nr:PAS domain S-box-containing protein/diguanylate cyclase (GGDEF) domain-containing protein [Pseudoxanthomonas sp. GM95]
MVLQEASRLAALQALDVLDTPAEPVFDDLAWLAGQLCEAPIALVSLVDEERQWFKARCGLAAQQTPRDMAFCAHTILRDTLMEVPDALEDARFADNPLVLGAPHIRFYAGAPLIGAEGHRYGSLCVIDTVPRTLSQAQHRGLVALARQVTESLEMRQRNSQSEAREQTLQLLLEAMPDAVVTCDAHGKLSEFNRQARQWHGLDPAAVPSERWAEHFSLYEVGMSRLLEVDEVPLARALRGLHVVELEIVICARGQPPRRVLCNAEPLHAPDGTLLGAVCVMHDVTRLRASQDAAQVEAQRFRDAFSAAAQGMALVSLEGKWLDVNNAACVIFGYSRDALMALDFQQLTHPDDLQADLELVHELLDGKRVSYQMDKRYFHSDGHTIRAHLAVSMVHGADGKPLHFVSQIQDLTQQWEVEHALRSSEERLRTIADNVPAMIGRVDHDMRYEFVNEPYARWFGLTPADIVGRRMGDLLRPEHWERIRHRAEAALAGETVLFDADVIDREGQLRHMHAAYIPTPRDADTGERIGRGFHLMVSDMTAQTRLSRMLEQRAMTDALTGLPNRAAWMVELDLEITRARTSQVPVAIMFIDLDGFKQVNDTYGHDVGDAVLVDFAVRLRETLREEDFIARLSGDEFVVHLGPMSNAGEDPQLIAAKVMAGMVAPLPAAGHGLRITPSIGVAIQAGPDYDAAELMKRADEAMYRVKRAQAQHIAID